MTLDKKAAECGDTQAAVKTSRARDHSTHKTPTSTFIQVDVHLGIGADTDSWYILQGWRYKGTHRWEPISWYGSSAPCANGLADKAVRTCGAQSLSQALIKLSVLPRRSPKLCGFALTWGQAACVRPSDTYQHHLMMEHAIRRHSCMWTLPAITMCWLMPPTSTRYGMRPYRCRATRQC